MSQRIASLFAEIGANTSGLEAGLSKSKSMLEGFAGSFKGDKLGASFQEAVNSVNANSDALSENDSVLSALNGTLLAAVPNLGKFGNAVLKTTLGNGGLLAMAGGAFLAVSAVTKLREVSEEGAGLLRIEESFEGVANSYGASSDYILSKIRELSNGTIANTDIMLAANRSMLLGVSSDAEEMAQITQVAIARGQAMGLTSAEAIDRVFTGIGRLSPKILDDLGIITNATAKYKEYAQAHGISTQAIDDFTKREIIKQAIIEDGQRLMESGVYDPNDAASSFERASVANQNYWDEFKKSHANAFKPLNNSWAEFVSNQADALRITRQMNEEGMRGPAAAYLARQKATAPVKEEFGRTGDDVYTSGVASQAMQQYAMDVGLVLDSGLSLSEMTEDYTMKLDSLNQKLAETSQKYGENSQKTLELQDQIGQLSTAHINAMDTMALKTLQAKEATDQMQLDFALASGMMTQSGYDQAVMMDRLASAYINGQLNASQYSAAVGQVSSMVAGLNGMSAAAYIDVYIRVHGDSSLVGNNFTMNSSGTGVVKRNSVSGQIEERRAIGGPVQSGNMYEVNEGGAPELLSVGGKTFLMMGSKGGYVSPAGNSSSGGGNSELAFAIASKIPSATENAKALARELVKMWS